MNILKSIKVCINPKYNAGCGLEVTFKVLDGGPVFGTRGRAVGQHFVGDVRGQGGDVCALEWVT